MTTHHLINFNSSKTEDATASVRGLQGQEGKEPCPMRAAGAGSPATDGWACCDTRTGPAARGVGGDTVELSHELRNPTPLT